MPFRKQGADRYGSDEKWYVLLLIRPFCNGYSVAKTDFRLRSIYHFRSYGKYIHLPIWHEPIFRDIPRGYRMNA